MALTVATVAPGVLYLAVPEGLPKRENGKTEIKYPKQHPRWFSLGMTKEGVDLNLDIKYQAFESDIFKEAEQYFTGCSVTVDADLILYDELQTKEWDFLGAIHMPPHDNKERGAYHIAPGSPVFSQNLFFSLALFSPCGSVYGTSKSTIDTTLGEIWDIIKANKPEKKNKNPWVQGIPWKPSKEKVEALRATPVSLTTSTYIVFPRCLISKPVEVTMGIKAKSLKFQWTAYPTQFANGIYSYFYV